MQQLVECVPNFSNGRNPAIYNQIAATIREVVGVKVLNVSADSDHNRTVITFVGAPDAVEEAAFRAIALAAQLINLDHHTGAHPRIGATDVCPFIPISGMTQTDCVQMAQRLGKRVGDELGITVYLYGAAAAQPNREKLAAIRKGEYELWKQEVATNPERKPDFGPATAQPWGATVIGVRPFLIAYNLYLNSDKVKIAEEIARAVRYLSGGLRNVQAKGFLVDGQAQVSMNLTDFQKTPIHRVQEMVRREAARYGLTITKAELIGLTPQKALFDAAKYYLQLDDMQDNQVLETQLYADPDKNPAPFAFLDATAAATAAPGGGSVAALAGALAAALTQMVAGLTMGRRKYAEVEDEAQTIAQEAHALRKQLTDAIEADAAAYAAVLAVFRDKGLSAEEKATAVESTTIKAAEVPGEVARLSLLVARLAQQIATNGNVNAVSDAAAAVFMARAAVQSAALNVKINAVSLQNRALAQTMVQNVELLEKEVAQIATAVAVTAAERGGF
ncbi:MAG: glutamate formimidoyltransferase [Anaerolineales bacterium]|nr:glutamate formimidoyltransferase [Anaerolineales bacterium]